MKYIVKLGAVLMIYTIIAGLVLGVVNHVTRPQIERQKILKEVQAKQEVMPAAGAFISDTIDGLVYDKAFETDGQNNLLGYIIKGEAKGYSSTVKVVTGLTTDFEIKNIEIISQEETPGLGANCENVEFKSQFQGISSPEEIAVKKDEGKIEALTGATITSRTVTEAVRESIKKLKSVLAAGEVK